MAKTETYFFLKERDGLKCGICKKSLTKEWAEYQEWMDSVKFHKRSSFARKKINLNIDHKIPRSRLKNKEYYKYMANLQLAHKTCNTEKGSDNEYIN